MQRVIRAFFHLSVVYFAVMLAVIWAFRDQPVLLLRNMLATPLFNLKLLFGFLPWLIVLLALVLWLNRQRRPGAWLPAVPLALLASFLFAFTFSAMKTTMPSILPYFADPFFAALDRALHFGTDPWIWTHRLSGLIRPQLAQRLYYDLWFVPAFFFPVILALLERDADRGARFLFLYAAVWIGLGNLLALAGLSAGPVYYQRLTGAADFAALNESLAAIGLAAAPIGQLQDAMWGYLVDGGQMQGAGISAFPSVHVGVAAVLALYVFERQRLLGLLALAYLAVILFLSVYLGWHYAVDGYFSILAVLVLWRLKWRLPLRGAG